MSRSFEERLASEPVVWLSSMRPDGHPHVVPTWFTWDGEALTVYSKPQAQKVRNLRDNPQVMLALGTPDETMDVELVEGCAEVLDATPAPAAARVAEKYDALMARVGLTLDQFVDTYSQAIRIRPVRAIGWGGPGWTHATAAR